MQPKNNQRINRKRYSISEKIEIINYKENDKIITQQNLSEKFKMSIGTVNKILKNKDKLMSINLKKSSKKLISSYPTEKIDDILY